MAGHDYRNALDVLQNSGQDWCGPSTGAQSSSAQTAAHATLCCATKPLLSSPCAPMGRATTGPSWAPCTSSPCCTGCTCPSHVTRTPRVNPVLQQPIARHKELCGWTCAGLATGTMTGHPGSSASPQRARTEHLQPPRRSTADVSVDLRDLTLSIRSTSWRILASAVSFPWYTSSVLLAASSCCVLRAVARSVDAARAHRACPHWLPPWPQSG